MRVYKKNEPGEKDRKHGDVLLNAKFKKKKLAHCTYR